MHLHIHSQLYIYMYITVVIKTLFISHVVFVGVKGGGGGGVGGLLDIKCMAVCLPSWVLFVVPILKVEDLRSNRAGLSI